MSRSMISVMGLSRKSSVPALKLNPRIPIRLCPTSIMSCIPLLIWSSLLGRIEVMMGKSKSWQEVRGRDIEFLVFTENLHNRVRINCEGLTNISNFIGKPDFEGVPSVIHVLHHLGGFKISPNQRGVQFGVECGQHIAAGTV